MDTILQKLLQTLSELLKTLSALLEKLKPSKGFDEFKEALGKRESGGNYQCVNPYGYLGKYQFGMARLCDLGYTQRKAGTTGYSNSCFEWKPGYSQEYFLNNPDFQEKIFKEHCDDLIRQINNRFSDYLDKTINNVKITLSGCVAGAHLAGINGLYHFLTSAYDSSDAFGTKISDYIKEFGGYKLL